MPPPRLPLPPRLCYPLGGTYQVRRVCGTTYTFLPVRRHKSTASASSLGEAENASPTGEIFICGIYLVSLPNTLFQRPPLKLAGKLRSPHYPVTQRLRQKVRP